MSKIRSRGFTLIELLVVIAIIGILSAVVLASLNTARSKGNDAAIKSNLDTIRTQSGIYYDSQSGYSNGIVVTATTGASPYGTTAMCNTSGASTIIFNDPNVASALAAADKAAAGAGTVGGVTKVLCASDAATAATKTTLWAVGAPLTATASTWWCVDSTGASKQEAGASVVFTSAGACP